MGEGDSNVVFNVTGTQKGVVNMAGRDMHVGSQTNVAADLQEIARDLESLREGLAATPLPPEVQEPAEAELQQAEEELTKEEPDRQVVADRVTQFASIVKGFGSLAGAGTLLVEPLTRLAKHLGPLGGALQRLLT